MHRGAPGISLRPYCHFLVGFTEFFDCCQNSFLIPSQSDAHCLCLIVVLCFLFSTILFPLSPSRIFYITASRPSTTTPTTTTSHQILSCRWEEKIFITSNDIVRKLMEGREGGQIITWTRLAGGQSERRGKRSRKTESERDQRETYSATDTRTCELIKKMQQKNTYSKCSKTQG